ncbi:predicted protein, partial [Nematostella vectensis]
IGMTSGYINSSRITASSSLGADYQPYYGRLSTNLGKGAWCALDQDDRQYLQVDLEVPYRIMGFSTQGKHRMSDDTIGHAWVTLYNVSVSSQGYDWSLIHDESNVTLVRVFAGNSISNLTVKHLLASPVVGRLVRFLPTAWYNRICMRVEVFGCKGIGPILCKLHYRTSSGVLKALLKGVSRITASSSLGADYQPYYGRLSTNLGKGAWCALDQDDRQYLQVDLEVPYRIMGFSTQGKHRMSDDTIGHAWVTLYNVSVSSQGYDWSLIHDESNVTLVRVFAGNSISNLTVKHLLASPVVGRLVRFLPTAWYNRICMRVEVFG